MNNFSIEKNKETILKPNSEFERRVILQYYLENDISPNTAEREILNLCTVSEPESIGIIGCLLLDKSHLNILRLAIGSKNKSNLKLAEVSRKNFTLEEVKNAENFYWIEKDFDDLTKVEIIVSTEFNIHFL